MTTALTTAPTAEAEAFAATVGQILADHPVPDVWRPGRPADDRSQVLTEALTEVGWTELAGDPEGLPFIGPAAVELGRGLAPVSEIDALLGAAPLHRGLTRYPGELVVERTPGRLRYLRVTAATPRAYGDCLAVHTVTAEPAGIVADPGAESAWLVAQTGYLTGLAAGALDLAVTHVKQRAAFGATLAALEGVQFRLADAAAAVEGLRGLVAAGAGADVERGHAALAYAGRAAETVVAQCHQVVGAIGFTLEFALHRYSRRARVLASWNDDWIEGALA